MSILKMADKCSLQRAKIRCRIQVRKQELLIYSAGNVSGKKIVVGNHLCAKIKLLIW